MHTVPPFIALAALTTGITLLAVLRRIAMGRNVCTIDPVAANAVEAQLLPAEDAAPVFTRRCDSYRQDASSLRGVPGPKAGSIHAAGNPPTNSIFAKGPVRAVLGRAFRAGTARLGTPQPPNLIRRDRSYRTSSGLPVQSAG